MIQSAKIPDNPARQIVLGLVIVFLLNMLLAFSNPLNAKSIATRDFSTSITKKSSRTYKTTYKKYYQFRCTKSMRCEGAKFFNPKKKRPIAIYLYD